jgi:anaerobic magnesium-protoporphyrin IX monomethyl ester cyclase
MKVLLASLSIEVESRGQNDPNAPYSIGLAYLNASLEKSGHEVRLLFLNNFDQLYSEESFFNIVDEWRPQLVGMQVFSMNRTSTFAAVEKLRRDYPEISVVIGGVHTSVMYEQILHKYPHVITVLGEGEITFTELCAALGSGTAYDSVAGIAYCRDGAVVVTTPRPLLKELDQLPFPKHEVFFDDCPERTVGHIISSRGCPFDCSFCCLKVISQRKYRARDVKCVIEEIVQLKNRYPRLTQIQFHDDTFLLNNQRVIEFCQLIIPYELGLTFVCSARVKPVSAEMFAWMKKAGFVKIMFGLETGSAKLLDSIHKKITGEDVLNLFRIIKPFNFTITTFLMVGFPGEDDDTVQETIDLVRATQKVCYNWIDGIGKLWVYPGTEVYRIMKESGRITDDYWLTDKFVPNFTVEHDLETLIRYEEKLMDNLAISRIFTLKGFKNHFLSMPLTIFKFVIATGNWALVAAIIKLPIQNNFPLIFKGLLKLKSAIKIS